MAQVNTTQERIELIGVDKFSQMFNKGKAQLGDLRSGLDSVKGALAAVGLTIGAGAMVKLYHDTLAAQSSLEGMAKATGSSVEGLSALQRVAKVGGHDFAGLQGQMARTIKSLQEGAEEGGKAATAYQFLGIKVRDTNGHLRDQDVLIVELAKKLATYRDDGSKVALLQDALGKGAERYADFLDDVAQGTDLVVTTTAKQAKEANEAEKAMRRFNVTLEDGRRILINEYVPGLRDMVEQLTEGVRITGSLGSAIARLGTMNPFRSPGGNIQVYNEELENLRAGRENMARMPGYEAAVAGIDQQIEITEQRKRFAQFLQRQQAARMTGDEFLDARDLALRAAGAERPSAGYRSPGAGGSKAATREAEREAEFREGKRLELAETTARDEREAWDFYYKYRDAQEKKVLEDLEFRAEKQAELEDMAATDMAEAWQAYYQTKEGRLAQHYDEQERMLRNARENGILTEEEYNEQVLELQMEHEQERTGIARSAALERMRFERSTLKQQAAQVFGELASITAGVAQHNKAMFKINKVAGIANAIISTHAGVTKSLEAYPMPLAAIMAGIHLAAGMAQVQAIASTEFEGGGRGAAPSIAGTTAAMPVAPVASAPAQPLQSTIINFQGTTDETKLIRRFVELLNENSRQGGRLILSGAS